MKRQHATVTHHTKDYLKFIIPSFIGMVLFMVPIPFKGEVTIPVALMAKWVQTGFQDMLPGLMTIIMGITVLGTIAVKIGRIDFLLRNHFLTTLFNVSPIWMIARILGFVFAVITLYKVGPEWIWSENTGALLLFDLIPILFSVFLFAGLLLPFLLDFGLLELFGSLLTKVMRPLFKLPGRASIDCLASWMGDGTIGVLLTNKQYEDGFYTKREAAVIGTTFSVVSITFSLVVITYMKLETLFVPFYLTITFAGFVAAVIMPRIPPLSRKPDTYNEKTGKQIDESLPDNMSMFKWGLQKAVQQAEKIQSYRNVLMNGFRNVLDMWMGVVPIVMAMGTLALIVAEYTPVFKVLGAPFIPILQLMNVPEAAEAAQTMVVGFADMFLPTVIGSEISSDLTRFVIAGVSVTQLIYMSEVGGLLLASKLHVTLKDLFIIFLERTIITLPIIAAIAHIIF